LVDDGRWSRDDKEVTLVPRPSSLAPSLDVLVVGGGVIGLSIARELALSSLRVALCDRQEPGREASWAGAGILPPGVPGPADAPANRLARATHELWPSLSAELLETTGIDNGYRRCGGFMLQGIPAETLPVTFRTVEEQDLSHDVAAWRECGAEVEPLSPAEIHRLEPALPVEDAVGFRLPGVCQVRNPRHLKALLTDCRRLGVEMRPGDGVRRLRVSDGRCVGVETASGFTAAGTVVVAAGAWSQALLEPAGVRFEVQPVRGQMALLALERPPFRHVIECGLRYLVPREDGRVLVGSTEELAGFRKETTPEAIDGLLAFAHALVPSLRAARVEQTWAGLRPYAACGSPLIGAARDVRGLYVAAGHFRSGLHLSPITARTLRACLVDSDAAVTQPAGGISAGGATCQPVL
jgi:glycine oxidase